MSRPAIGSQRVQSQNRPLATPRVDICTESRAFRDDVTNSPRAAAAGAEPSGSRCQPANQNAVADQLGTRVHGRGVPRPIRN